MRACKLVEDMGACKLVEDMGACKLVEDMGVCKLVEDPADVMDPECLSESESSPTVRPPLEVSIPSPGLGMLPPETNSSPPGRLISRVGTAPPGMIPLGAGGSAR